MADLSEFKRAQARAVAAGIGCAALEFGELQASDLSEPAVSDDSHIVCWFEDGEVQMTEALWARVLEMRRRLGRPVTAADLRGSDGAEGAVDDHA